MIYPLIDKKLLNKLNIHSKNFITGTKSSIVYSYFLIKCVKNDFIIITFYADKKTRDEHTVIFCAKNAQVLCKLLELHNKVKNCLSASHAFYIGRELMKAEFAMILGQDYIQD